MSDQLALGQLEQVLGGWIRIANAEFVTQQYDRGGKQFQARIRGGIRFDGGEVRSEHRVPPKRCDDSSKFRARTAWARAGVECSRPGGGPTCYFSAANSLRNASIFFS